MGGGKCKGGSNERWYNSSHDLFGLAVNYGFKLQNIITGSSFSQMTGISFF
jgi:hypothetical protein